jgi:acetylornithine deacetylase/succinyl-diaminopimelate desuccinylase-like protein
MYVRRDSAPQEELLEAMQRLVAATVATAAASAGARGAAACTVHAAEHAPPVAATEMDAGLVECFRRAAVATVGEEEVFALPSAALHDASPARRMGSLEPEPRRRPSHRRLTCSGSGSGCGAQLAEVMPAAMLFVPSINGLSHSYDEHTQEADIAAGAAAYVRAAVQLALGECASLRGPTCIVQDARLARLWANAIEVNAAEDDEEREGGESPPPGDPDDLSLYPDI